jgi:type I restriction enzyme S subunit
MKRWPTKPLGELLLTLESGSRPKGGVGEIPDGIPSVSGEHINREGEFYWDTPKHITRDFYTGMKRGRIQRGDILVVKDGATTGKTAMVRKNFPFREAAINEHVFLLRTDKSKALPEYVGYFLFSPVGQRQILSNFRGAAIGGIAQDFVCKVHIPLAPLAEQERIVKMLDEADELRKLRAQADRRTIALIPALFNEMFAKAKFTEKTVGEYLEDGWLLLHKDGNHGSLYPRASDFGNEGIPFLTATCVTEKGAIQHSEVKRLSENKSKQLRHGWLERDDVLLAHNATVGKVGYYEGDYDRALIGTSLTTFRVNPERIDSRFLWAALRDEFFQHQLERIMKQALRNQVPITAQRELLLRVPHLTLQKEFAQRVSEIRELEAAQAASCQRVEHLFQSMLHRAFNQEL